MTFRELIPFSFTGTRAPVRPRASDWVSSFHNEVDNMFRDLFRGIDSSDLNQTSFTPVLNLEEDEREITATLEVPGLEEKDLDITFEKDRLIVKGERHLEKKEGQGTNRTYYESSYGSFMRLVPLPAEIDEDKVEATLKRGVLTIRLPKVSPEKSGKRKISVRNGD